MDFRKGEIIAIDKPYRMSSFGALAHVRYLLSKKLGFKVKIGHAGTLDPLATGVLGALHRKMYQADRAVADAYQGIYSHPSVGCYHAQATTMEHPVNHTYPTEHITRELRRGGTAAVCGRHPAGATYL